MTGVIEFLVEIVGCAVVWRVENREVLTDGLFRAVALDLFSPGIPGCNVPAQVEMNDGVIRHPFHQATVARVHAVQRIGCAQLDFTLIG